MISEVIKFKLKFRQKPPSQPHLTCLQARGAYHLTKQSIVFGERSSAQKESPSGVHITTLELALLETMKASPPSRSKLFRRLRMTKMVTNSQTRMVPLFSSSRGSGVPPTPQHPSGCALPTTSFTSTSHSITQL